MKIPTKSRKHKDQKLKNKSQKAVAVFPNQATAKEKGSLREQITIWGAERTKS